MEHTENDLETHSIRMQHLNCRIKEDEKGKWFIFT